MHKWVKDLLNWRKKSTSSQIATSIDFDGVGVIRRRSDGVIEYVEWDNLEEVGVRTTGTGPYFEDFFLLLHGKDNSGCVLPLQEAIDTGIVEKLQSLPGFDNEKLMQASLDLHESYYICWQKNDIT